MYSTQYWFIQFGSNYVTIRLNDVIKFETRHLGSAILGFNKKCQKIPKADLKGHVQAKNANTLKKKVKFG